jgi:hypothetical protein
MSKILRLLNISENTSLNNRLPLVAGMMDNRVLSKNNSGQASRYSLAFFVSKFWLASQATQDSSTTHHPKSTGVNRHTYANSVTSYGGVTLQNKPVRQICRAVTIVTESEPRHPMTFHSVVLTQKAIGVVNHG